jgi:hypothetical protein
MSDTARLAAMATAHAARRQTIIVKLLKLLLGLWGDFGSARDVDVVAGLAARSATLVGSSMLASRKLERAYLTTVLRELDAAPSSLPDLVNPYPRSGVSGMDVYRRPAEQFVYALSQGSSVEDARTIGVERLTGLGTQDVKLAERDEADRVYKASGKVIGWRRIIHPELSKTGTCGLCLVAATRFYTRGDLMPLHGPSCNCGTFPVTKTDDPGLKLNQDDLQNIYDTAGSTAAEDLLNTRVQVNEHGELGPILVREGDHFRTAKDAGRPEYVKPTPKSIRSAQEKAVGEARGELSHLQSLSNPDARSIKYVREHLTTLEQALKLAA